MISSRELRTSDKTAKNCSPLPREDYGDYVFSGSCLAPSRATGITHSNLVKVPHAAPLNEDRIAVALILPALLIGIGLCGCALTPPVPSDLELRKLGSSYIRTALEFRENPVVRAQAAEAAADVLTSEAGLLIREALHDEHPGVRFAACMALGKIKDTGSLPAIRTLVNDSDPNVRVGAYYAMERMGDSSYGRRHWRDALLKHEDPTVRRNAAQALGQLEDKSVIKLLKIAADQDPDDGVRLLATEAQALLGDQDAVNRFIQDAYGGLGFKQPFALLTLGRVTDTRVVPALRARLTNAPYLEAQLAAARGLGKLGYDDGYELALKSLNWNDPQEGLPDDPPANQIMRVRTMAALALGEIGDRRALGWLKQRMETPDDPRVQLASATAILMILNKTSVNQAD